MSGSQPPPPLCRYFANGCCTQGANCRYSHDQSAKPDQVCRFYLSGSCGYGTACRYDHVRPKATEKINPRPSSSAPKPSAKAPTVSAAVLQKTKEWRMADAMAATSSSFTFSPDAAVFVPRSTAAAQESGTKTSYASAVGHSHSNAPTFAQSPHQSMTDVPLCPYFEQAGECTDAHCTFLHGEKCDLCNLWILNPNDPDQCSRHIAECTQKHEIMMEISFAEARSKGKICGICIDEVWSDTKRGRFGILEGCTHCFCLDCIREWRAREEFEKKTVRSCPECRSHSNFVVPSMYWVEDPIEKQALIEEYQAHTSNKICKYYLDPLSSEECPFGNKCWYRHQRPDGTRETGLSPSQIRRRRPAPLLSSFLFFNDDSNDDLDEDGILQAVLESLRRLR